MNMHRLRFVPVVVHAFAAVVCCLLAINEAATHGTNPTVELEESDDVLQEDPDLSGTTSGVVNMASDEFYAAHPAVVITSILWLLVLLGGCIWAKRTDSHAFPGLPLFRKPRKGAAPAPADDSSDSELDDTTQRDVDRQADATISAVLSAEDSALHEVSAVAPVPSTEGGSDDDMPEAPDSPLSGIRPFSPDETAESIALPGAVDAETGLPQLRAISGHSRRGLVDMMGQESSESVKDRLSRFKARHTRFDVGGLGGSSDEEDFQPVGDRVAVEALAFAPDGSDSTSDDDYGVDTVQEVDVVGAMVAAAATDAMALGHDDDADLWRGEYGDSEDTSSDEDGSDLGGHSFHPNLGGRWAQRPGETTMSLDDALAVPPGDSRAPRLQPPTSTTAHLFAEESLSSLPDSASDIGFVPPAQFEQASTAPPGGDGADLATQLFSMNHGADTDSSDALSTVDEDDEDDASRAAEREFGRWIQ